MNLRTDTLRKSVLPLLMIVFMLIMAGRTAFIYGQKQPALYNPQANAKADIEIALKQARKTDKQVFIQLGGNWCTWCIAFNRFVKEDTALSRALNDHYVVYHLNYSPENKNVDLLKRYGFPQRFGFPCFLILNQKGDVIHIQNSAYLEKGKGYDREKVLQFFNNWTLEALSEATYRKQLGL